MSVGCGDHTFMLAIYKFYPRSIESRGVTFVMNEMKTNCFVNLAISCKLLYFASLTLLP